MFKYHNSCFSRLSVASSSPAAKIKIIVIIMYRYTKQKLSAPIYPLIHAEGTNKVRKIGQHFMQNKIMNN